MYIITSMHWHFTFITIIIFIICNLKLLHSTDFADFFCLTFTKSEPHQFTSHLRCRRRNTEDFVASFWVSNVRNSSISSCKLCFCCGKLTSWKFALQFVFHFAACSFMTKASEHGGVGDWSDAVRFPQRCTAVTMPREVERECRVGLCCNKDPRP